VETALGALIALALVVATVLVHYEALRWTYQLIPELRMPPRSRILVAIAAIFVAHFVEIGLYATTYYIMDRQLALGSLGGEVTGNALDYFYFSVTNFTTLGIGDIFPHGMMRLVAGVESLNGLVLIGWSASFTYVLMEKLWDLPHR
jgi:hypothetical protein